MTNLTNAARTKQLETLRNVGALLFRRGYKLKAAQTEAVKKGLVAADDFFSMGWLNEGWQQAQVDAINEAA